MPPSARVDPAKERVILVVHGVQAGDDAGLRQDELIQELVDARLAGGRVGFQTRLYKYENINDEAQERLRRLIGMFSANMLARKAIDMASDLALDVLVNLQAGETARVIREGLKERILSLFHAGHPVYVVAHSLGSVYSFDVVNELMADGRFFSPGDRKTWPVQALMTLGSPLGLRLFGRGKVHALGPEAKAFRWINHWDRTDPVVSGSFYGRPQEGYDIAQRFTNGSGWFIQDRALDTGKAWLAAHTAYWSHPQLGDDLIHMVTR